MEIKQIMIGNIQYEIGMIIKTKYDCIAKIIAFKNEAISGNTLIIVDKECKGIYDDKYGYDRGYYEKGFWIYPGEILSIVNESQQD